MQKDIETLTTLNHDFVKSVQGADVKRFDEILAKDFLFTNPDGSLYNRAEFLDLIGKGARNSELREDQVNVRLFGDFAIIHARIQYRSKAGIEHIGRYTDDWARREALRVRAYLRRGSLRPPVRTASSRWRCGCSKYRPRAGISQSGTIFAGMMPASTSSSSWGVLSR